MAHRANKIAFALVRDQQLRAPLNSPNGASATQGVTVAVARWPRREVQV